MSELEQRARKLGVPFVDLQNLSIERELYNSVPDRYCKLHTAVPLKREGRRLWLAMADPSDVVAIDDFARLTLCHVVPVLADREAIQHAIRLLDYDPDNPAYYKERVPLAHGVS